MLELVTNTLTAPGVVVHEYAHILAARSRGLRVRDAVLFRPFANPAGYVNHAPARGNADAVVVGVSPFAVNTLLAAAVALLSVPAYDMGAWPLIGVWWLSWSLALHALPSLDDMADVDGVASALLAPLKILKIGEVVGTGYAFATAVTATGALVSIAIFVEPAAAVDAATRVFELVRGVLSPLAELFE